LFFSDFQSYEASLNNAWVKFKPASFIDLTLGRFLQPFGGELGENIAAQVYPEKSRYWAYLFNKDYNNGIGVDFHTGIFHWNNAFFYSFTDGYSIVREQDFVSKLYLETGFISTGLGFFTNIKKLSGTDLPSDITGNFFMSFFDKTNSPSPVWKLSLEITGIFTSFENFENAGEGAHVSFEYLFLNRFKLGNRFSAMYLADNLTASEIDLSRESTDVTPGWAFDYMLTIACYFANQNIKDARQDRISFSYNPGLYLDGELAHAMYIEAVVAF
jgi:hypothetical protein